MESCVSESLHPISPHDLPGFLTAPGDTDTLMVVVGVILIAAVLGVGNIYLHWPPLPERMAHKSQKLQFEIVAVLGLLALFTHNHLFWVIGLLLAMIDLPDFSTPLSSIAGSVEKIAGLPPDVEATEITGESAAHAGAAEEHDTTKGGAAKRAVRSHARAASLLLADHPSGLSLSPLWAGKTPWAGDHVIFGMVRTEVGHHHLSHADRRSEHGDLLFSSILHNGNIVFQ